MYLTPELAIEKLIDLQILKSPPRIATVAAILQQIEMMIDNWVGYPMTPTLRKEVLYTGNCDRVITTWFPIIEVVEILPLPETGITTPMSKVGVWTGQLRSLRLPPPGALVTYTTGIDPLPVGLDSLIVSILATVPALKDSSAPVSLAHLTQPQSSVKQIVLPSGLSKTFEVSKVAAGKTDLDAFLEPLLGRYKNHLITGGSTS
jgi:hypothetical protein